MEQNKISEYIEANPLSLKAAEITLDSARAKANVNLHREAIAIIEAFLTSENPSWILTDQKPTFKPGSWEHYFIQVIANLYDVLGSCYLHLNLLPKALKAYKLASHELVESNISVLSIYVEMKDYGHLVGLANYLKETHKDYPDENFLTGVMLTVGIGAMMRGNYEAALSELKLVYQRVANDQQKVDDLFFTLRELSGKAPNNLPEKIIKSIKSI